MAQPGDDRSPDDVGDESPFGADDATRLDASRVVIPDDPRDLAPDVAAYHRELRAARRRRRLERVFRTRRWGRYGVSPIVVGILVVVAAVGSLLIAVHPTGDRELPSQQDLATVAGPTGTIGGLIPDVTLQSAGTAMSAQSLRPGLVVLVPPACDCTSTLDRLAGQAFQFRLRMWVVASSVTDQQIDGLVSEVHRGQVSAAVDAQGALAEQYDAHGVTAILLRQDGVVAGVVPDLTSTSHLDDRLGGLTPSRT